MNSRKIISVWGSAVFVVFVFVAVPILFILLNNYFGLPVFSNIFLKIIGMILVVTGLSAAGYSALQHMKTDRITYLPVVDEPKKFIVSGLYKYCRNPMYLVETIVFIGIFLISGHWLLITLPIVFLIKVHLLVVFVEEPEMNKKFGEEYIKYTKSVPRWIPKRI